MSLKNLIKKISKTALGQILIAFLVACYILLIRLTCRIHRTNSHVIDDFSRRKQPVILTIWHGRLLMMPLLFPKPMKAYTLISDHSDGKIVKKTARFFGYKTIIGSSHKGGTKAFKEMITAIKKGVSLFITPDGPQGPAQKFQAGAAEVSRMTGAPLLAVSMSASPAKFAKSWDNFMLPKLFSHITIHYGEPLYLDKKATHEERQAFYKRCEEMLVHLEEEADNEAKALSK